MRCDWSPRGFHATIVVNGQAILVHPSRIMRSSKPGEIREYASYRFEDLQEAVRRLSCEGVEFPPGGEMFRLRETVKTSSISLGDTLRTYRIAIATTQEFTNAPALGGGTVAGALAALNSLLNSVNAIYERELSIRLMLVANNDQIIYTAEPDP